MVPEKVQQIVRQFSENGMCNRRGAGSSVAARESQTSASQIVDLPIDRAPIAARPADAATVAGLLGPDLPP